MTNEHKRLEASKDWKKWGPYISERQWGTVREDYSESGMAWESVTHDMARSKAYRWGEDGIGGICDENQRICFSWAFWNTKDPIIKERLFGLSGVEGNHGEDVKELYYYLENTPTHSYMKMLYKYPQQAFPYVNLVEVNKIKSKLEREYELMDTGVFDQDEYFDIFMEYAKEDTDDLLLKINVHNRSSEEAPLVIMPTVWFRNTWSSRKEPIKPALKQTGDSRLNIRHHEMGSYLIYFEEEPDEFAFCNNETNRKRLYDAPNSAKYTKDGINDYLVSGKKTVSSRKSGTKCAAIYRKTVPANGSITLKVRMTKTPTKEPFEDFDKVYEERINDCNDFYRQVQGDIPNQDHLNIQRQAYAGMLWSKQFYYYNVKEWLDGDTGRAKPPSSRKKGRNSSWTHLDN
ncbi:MAG: glucosidase, partial [Bacteroidota bacterium]